MHYKFKVEKIDELKDGRTIVNLSQITGYSRQYLTEVLNGRWSTTKESALIVLNKLKDYSVKINMLINSVGAELTLEYFFEKV